jgi:DNA-binding SARP family transcriptional activator
MTAARLYLAGQLAVETEAGLADLRGLPGRQGRRAYVYLVLERTRPIPHSEMAEAIWGADLPRGWDAALSAIVSKLRRFVATLAGAAIRSDSGCYQLRLPAETWVDVEVAIAAVDTAEGALRRGDWRTGWASAAVAQAIARRPFLAGEEAGWIVSQRTRLRQLLLRAWDCLADCWLAGEQYPMAVEAGAQSVALEPLRETSYQRLMRAHFAMGNRGEALRAYAQCRRLLVAELGVEPSPQTEAIYLEVLRA